MNDYWVVTDKRTGRVICHCGEEQDAIRMILFDHNRVYRKQKFLMDQVINVSSSGIKELPGQQGLPEAKTSFSEDLADFWWPKNELPEGQEVALNLE